MDCNLRLQYMQAMMGQVMASMEWIVSANDEAWRLVPAIKLNVKRMPVLTSHAFLAPIHTCRLACAPLWCMEVPPSSSRWAVLRAAGYLSRPWGRWPLAAAHVLLCGHHAFVSLPFSVPLSLISPVSFPYHRLPQTSTSLILPPCLPSPQLRELERGCEFLVATPGRLIDIMDRARVSLRCAGCKQATGRDMFCVWCVVCGALRSAVSCTAHSKHRRCCALPQPARSLSFIHSSPLSLSPPLLPLLFLPLQQGSLPGAG